jgi:hypothetical protein
VSSGAPAAFSPPIAKRNRFASSMRPDTNACERRPLTSDETASGVPGLPLGFETTNEL